jgi:glycosyltransferase involved in cell wall biosynthesis
MGPDVQAERRWIVLVTERRLFPPHQGNRARIVQLIRSLRAAGFRVALVSRHVSRWDVWLRTRWLVDALLTVRAGGFAGGRPEDYDCSPFLPTVAAAVRRFRPVAVIAEYLWMTPCLDAVPPETLTMVDTHDLMHVRSGLYHGMERGAWVECSREEEARLLARAEVVLAIQEREQEAFRALVPASCVVCVPHFSELRPPRRARGHYREMVAFVGSGNVTNTEALDAFLREGWPRVRERCPAAELHVFGKVADRLESAPVGVVLVGAVRGLEAIYERANVVVNPVLRGTGLKIKSVEALAWGRALVTTSPGSEGMEDGLGEAFLVEDEMARFGDAVAGLLIDPEARAALECAALAYSARRFSRAETLRELLPLLTAARSPAQRPAAEPADLKRPRP